LLQRLTGIGLSPERPHEVLAAYAPILDEIATLRALDLQDIQPVVIFEPTAAYRSPR
jgi:hypothetical protein